MGCAGGSSERGHYKRRETMEKGGDKALEICRE